MLALNEAVVITAADLAADCEYAALHQAARLRSSKERPGEVSDPGATRRPRDPMGARIGALSGQRRDRTGRRLAADHPGPVVQVRRGTRSRASYQRWHRETMTALRSGAGVISTAGFFDGTLQVSADFLIATEQGYRIELVTMATRVRPRDLIQAGAVASMLTEAGIQVADEVRIDCTTGSSSHPSTVAQQVATYRRHWLTDLLTAHVEPDWGDDRWWACGYCTTCRAAIEQHRDLLLVWGLRRHHRAAMRSAGIATIDDLAAVDDSAGADVLPDLPESTLAHFRAQARVQLRQEDAEAAGAETTVFGQVHTPEVLARLPQPSSGDVFFDFEGDPHWHDPRHAYEWGLQYLFGLLEADSEQYVSFWAHSLAEEKQALADFLTYIKNRRIAHPDMHIYHYAFYEPATLRKLTQRHGMGADQVEELIAAGVFVDLYEAVKGGVHISQRSFSLKKLEPLYMGTYLRTDAAVTDGGASIIVYHEASQALERGDRTTWRANLADLAEYNRYDCLSTWRLRDWLLSLVAPMGQDLRAADSPVAPLDSGGESERSAPVAGSAGSAGSASSSQPQDAMPADGDSGIHPFDVIAEAGSPRIHLHRLQHRQRHATSPEEAAEALTIVRTEIAGGSNPADILVVAATKEQAELITWQLSQAGIVGITVTTPDGYGGTIDQAGSDHAVVVLSMTTSTLADAPRRSILLDPAGIASAAAGARDRVLIIHSDQLLATLPRSAADLGGYEALLSVLDPAPPVA